MNENELRMLGGPYRVVVKDYDEGHGGSVPSDYQVQNNMDFVCTVSSSKEAEKIRNTYNKMRIMLLEKLLAEAKEFKE